MVEKIKNAREIVNRIDDLSWKLGEELTDAQDGYEEDGSFPLDNALRIIAEIDDLSVRLGLFGDEIEGEGAV